MKKLIYRFLILGFIILLSSITYLSVIGIETNRFNKQISSKLKGINKDLVVELKKIKIILSPFELKFKIKTYGLKIRNKDKIIELDNIQTKISINSYFNNQFILSDLDISTKPIKIKNLLSFLRTFKKDPELYIIKRFIKKGYLIADVKLEFDSDGKIKNNYLIKGIVRDSKIDILDRYNLSNINFFFKIKDKNFSFQDISLSLNDINFLSKKIHIEGIKDKFFIKGEFNNKDINVNGDIVQNFINSSFPEINIKDINLSSNSKFSFYLNKKLDIDKLKISSELKLDNLVIKNKSKFKKFLPEIKDEINFSNHLIKIDYSQKKLSILGEGNVQLQKKKDLLSYTINKNNNLYEFEASLNILEDPLFIKFLNYQNDKDTKIIKLAGKHLINKGTNFKYISLDQNENKIKINDIIITNDFKIKSFKKLILDFYDKDKKKNKISIIKKKNNYLMSGPNFNVNSLLENLINNDSKQGTNFFSDNFELDFKIDKVYLDKTYEVKDLVGNLYFKDNEVAKADIDAFFPNGQKLKFTIKSTKDTKVTTFFLDQAEPFIKKYEFIKGFSGGSLDFYSSKTKNISTSTIKIYDFKLKELPALTKILTLASLQGIVGLLSGEGIGFNEFEMNFQSEGDLMTIDEIYAIGPAISILMNGYVEKNKIVSLRGTLVPATTINKIIGSIPILGKVLVGSKTGEGVFGVSFKIKGPPKKLETTVNPIKSLTPRFITRTLEKIKKN